MLEMIINEVGGFHDLEEMTYYTKVLNDIQKAIENRSYNHLAYLMSELSCFTCDSKITFIENETIKTKEGKILESSIVIDNSYGTITVNCSDEKVIIDACFFTQDELFTAFLKIAKCAYLTALMKVETFEFLYDWLAD